MKKALFIVMVLGVLFLTSGLYVFAQTTARENKQEALKVQDVGNKICPVTGEKIPANSNITYEYKGKIYHFCCAGCPEEFKKDPEKYIKKIEEEKQAESKK